MHFAALDPRARYPDYLTVDRYRPFGEQALAVDHVGDCDADRVDPGLLPAVHAIGLVVQYSGGRSLDCRAATFATGRALGSIGLVCVCLDHRLSALDRRHCV